MAEAATRRESISVKSIFAFVLGCFFGCSSLIFLVLVAVSLAGCTLLPTNNGSVRVSVSKNDLCTLWELVPFDFKVDYFSDVCGSPLTESVTEPSSEEP